jgi:hypothetical protein
MSSRRMILRSLAVLLIGAPTAAIAHSTQSGPAFMRQAVLPGETPLPAAPHVASNSTASIRPLAGVLFMAGGAVAFWGGRSRRLRLVGLSLFLVVGAYEGAIHSVHHLGDADAASQCRVASSNEHITVIDVDVPGVARYMLPVSDSPPPVQPSRALTISRAPDVGRAPPA